ncbi:MAG: CHAD domain-containing protein [Candidatus Binataceae bacterium]
MGASANIATQPRRLALCATDAIGDCARNALAAGVAAIERNRIPAEMGEAEAIHRLRVATRRLRASIRLFAGALHAARIKFYERDLPWIAAQAGAARECDVMAALLQDRAKRIDPALANEVAPIIDVLAARRAGAHRKLCESLRSRRYRNLIAKLEAPAIKSAPVQIRLGAAAASAMRPIARAAARMGAQLAPGAQPIVFHRLRVRVKRLRYALEMLSALGGKRHRKALARLEELQETLGLCNDAAVAMAWLRAYAESSGATPKTILAAGALSQAIAERERKLRRRSIKQWRRIERSGLVRDAIDEIRTNGRAALAAAAKPEEAAETNSGPAKDSAADGNDARRVTEVQP